MLIYLGFLFFGCCELMYSRSMLLKADEMVELDDNTRMMLFTKQ